jgi:hypothetical protein
MFFGTMLNSYGPAQAAFGMIQSSAGRASMITAAAEQALRGTPMLDQLLELMVETEKMAGRRNDIAHGLVRHQGAIDNDTKKRTSFGYYLQPANYNTLKARKVDQQFAQEIAESFGKLGFLRMHKYAYTAADVTVYANAFKDLYRRLNDLLKDVTRHCRKPHLPHQPQSPSR